ncbi:MAG: C45 family autoproteolytic acyltransferase/hydrolase [Candidatus Thorarchaeota archaeon]|jgi:predicted choloylglycine hydrolase
MRHIETNGDYETIGKQIGASFKKEEQNYYFPEASETKLSFMVRCEEVIREHIPEILDEVDSFVETTGWDERWVKADILAVGYMGSCSVLAVSGDHTDDGRPIVGRNYDWLNFVQPYFMAVEVNPTSKLRSLHFSDTPVSSYGGVNKAGLVIGIAVGAMYGGHYRPGIPVNLATRWMLDHFRTTEDAVSFLKGIPHLAGHNYLIADKQGSMVRVEVSPERVVVCEPEDGLILATNHFQSSEMKALENRESDPGSTYKREAAIRDWFVKQRGNIRLEDMTRILSGHDAGLCDHFRWGEQEGGTNWSWIVRPGSTEILVAHGPPCRNQYSEIRFKV